MNQLLQPYKNPLKSKTLWFNLIIAVLALFWPAGRDYLVNNPEASVILFTVVNALLRLITKDKLKLS